MRKNFLKIFLFAIVCLSFFPAYAADETDWEFFDWDSLKGDKITLVGDVPERAYEYTDPEITSPLAEYSFGTEKFGSVNLYHLENGLSTSGKKSAVFEISADFKNENAYFAKNETVLKKYPISTLLKSPVTFSVEGQNFCVSAVKDTSHIYLEISSANEIPYADTFISENGNIVKTDVKANSVFFTNYADYCIITAFYSADGAMISCVCEEYPSCGYFCAKPDNTAKVKVFVFASKESAEPLGYAEN